MTDTYNNWINWYHQRPSDGGVTPPSDDGDDSTPVADPVDVAFGTAAPQDFSEKNFMVEGSVGSLKRQKKNIAPIDFGTVQYASLEEYLNATQLGDRSGFFSSVDFKDTTGRERRKANALNALPLTGAGLAMLPFSVALMESKTIKDPTGKFDRAIPKSGVFNVAASMAIAEEYRELYNIRDHQLKNPDLKGTEAGFGFSVGDVNIYRRPGENLYRGQLDRAGLNQQTARSMEQYVSGTQKGTELVSAMLRAANGDETDPGSVALNDSQRAILQTVNGGYLLNGNFHFGSGIAAYGYDEDMVALGASVFSANGMLPETQSTALARQWRASAKALPRNATAAEKLANLNAHIRAATTLHQSNVAKESRMKAELAAKQRQAAVSATRSDVEAANQRLQQATEAARQASEARRQQQGDESDERREERQQSYQSSGMTEREARSASTEASRYEAMAASFGFAEGGDIPAEDEPFIAGAPDGNEPMITGNELIEASGEESGFIDRPPSEVTDSESVADNKEMKADEGGYVINAAAVTEAGEQDISKMIKDAEDYLRKEGREVSTEKSEQNILVSAGEVYISKEVADVIGRDRLRKINNRGLPKTEEKIQKAARGGKVKSYQEGGDVEGDGAYDNIVAAYDKFKNRFPGSTNLERVENARKSANEIIRGMNPEDALAIAMIGEASILGDEGMEAVGHVINNRANSTYREYADQESVYDVLTRRLPMRDYQFNALEFRTFRKTLKDIATTDYGRKKYEQMRQVASDILSGDRQDITGGSLLFWNPQTSTNRHIREGIEEGVYEVAYTQGTGKKKHQFVRPVGTEMAANMASSEFGDVSSGFMVPELPATPEVTPAQQTTSPAVTMAPPKKTADMGFMSMGDSYP